MNELIITKAVKEDLPAILDVQKKAFMEVARIFHLKTMPQIEQTLESITDEFNSCIFLKASIVKIPLKKINAISDKSMHFKPDSPKSLDSSLRGCVTIAICHCETPLRRCGNLIFSRAYEIASLITFTRKDITTQSLRGNDTCAKIVGSVRAYCKNGTCYIHRLVVLPEYQNKGVGKALMSAIEEHFKDKVARYELFTGSKDHRNLYFYNQLGYNAFKTEKHNNEISFVYLKKNVKA